MEGLKSKKPGCALICASGLHLAKLVRLLPLEPGSVQDEVRRCQGVEEVHLVVEFVHVVEQRLLEKRVALSVLLASPSLPLSFVAGDCLFGVVGLSVADDILECLKHPRA